MFICDDCGYVFDEPKVFEERHPYGGGYASEHLACCPNCDGSFSTARKCSCCGEYFAKEELEDGLCPDCYDEECDEDE